MRIRFILRVATVWLLLTGVRAKVSAQASPRLYGVGDVGLGKVANETGFTLSLGSAAMWSRIMVATRVDAVFVPSSQQSRCRSSITSPMDWNSLCDPRVARVGVMLDVDLMVPSPSRPFFVGVGYRAAGAASTAIGSAGVFFHPLDRPVNGYLRLTGGRSFIELSVGAFMPFVR